MMVVIDMLGLYLGFGLLFAMCVFVLNTFAPEDDAHGELGIVLVCFAWTTLWPLILIEWLRQVVTERYGK